MSRDDTLLAIGTETNIKVWWLESGIMRLSRTITAWAGRNTRPNFTQKISFSTDNELVIVATRWLDGQISVDTWTVNGENQHTLTLDQHAVGRISCCLHI